MKTRTEFLFAHWAVAALENLRGERWRELVRRVATRDAMHPDAMAFALMMTRVNGCVTCDIRRYRERDGCGHCSQFVMTTLNKENETAFLARFRAAQKEIERELKSRQEQKKVA